MGKWGGTKKDVEILLVMMSVISRLGGRPRAKGYRRYRTRLTSTSTPTNLDGIAAPALFNKTNGPEVLDLSVREPNV